MQSELATVKAGTGEAPLCVDLDGTLVRTDLLHEALFALLRQDPLALLAIPGWLAAGRARLKAEIARRVDIEPATLPYDQGILSFLRQEAGRGRRIVLATASPRRWADRIAGHLGLFAEVHATEGDHNLSAERKAARLADAYGAGGFDYIGDSAKDLPVWRGARQAMLAGRRAGGDRPFGDIPFTRRFPATGGGALACLRGLRLYQWTKNLLVLAPLVAAHRFGEVPLVVDGLLAFLAFGLCASAVYVLNDLMDVAADRAHPRKRRRPFAAGDVPVMHGAAVAAALLAAAAGISLLLPPLFVAALGFYFLVTFAYSVRLKRVVLLDVMVLAGLYTLRIIAGGAAVDIMPSFWLLAFSMFFFLSLALAKRYAELIDTARRSGQQAAGRGYSVDDNEALVSMGAAAGYTSVLVIALYIQGEAARNLYRFPEAIWLICPLLLYWVSRIWLAARRGKLHDDPIVFALKDRVSRVVIGLGGVVYLAATYMPPLLR